MSKNVRMEGFLLPYWLKSLSLWNLSSQMKASKKLIGEVKVNKCVGLHYIKEAIEEYQSNMSNGKFILKPSLTDNHE